MNVEDVIRAVNALDLKAFSLENVEILQRMLPTEAEVRLSLPNGLLLFLTSFNVYPGESIQRLRDIEKEPRSVDRRGPFYLSTQFHGKTQHQIKCYELHWKLL